MKLTMLGTGCAQVTACYNTCFVLSEEGTAGAPSYFLVDGGGGSQILSRLKDARIDWRSVRDIFLTHKHMDHILGVLWMARMICQGIHRRQYEGEARIYGHADVLQALRILAEQVLNEGELACLDVVGQTGSIGAHAFAGGRLRLIPVKDQEEKEILGHRMLFFDTGSAKALQMGFSMELAEPDVKLTCCGDETCRPRNYALAEGSHWLFHEAFCLHSQADRFRPYERGHSTVMDACMLAEKLEVDNLLLYHTEDQTIQMRKGLYTAEGRRYFHGGLFVPDDLEVLSL